jgi:hypothetical protein
VVALLAGNHPLAIAARDAAAALELVRADQPAAGAVGDRVTSRTRDAAR